MSKKILAGTAAVALGFLWIAAYAADNTSRLPKGLRMGIQAPPQLNKASSERISSILQGLERNVILESTRGEKDVGRYKQSASAVVIVFTDKSFGSGAIIDSKGWIITNWHVVGANHEVHVALKPKDGSEPSKDLIYSATVERIDEVADLALLRMHQPPKSLSVFKLGSPSALNVGQDVYAIGHPQSEVWTYTKGIISQIRNNYEWSGLNGVTHRARVIQTQTPINPGNSGGPLLDDGGRLVGINSFGRSGSEGLNYAVAVDEIQGLLQRKEHRVATRQISSPSHGQASLSCPEAYDTKGLRWTDIVGCYNSRTSPPPEFWIVFDGPKSVAFMARSTFVAGKIDTLITNADPNWQSLLYAYDTDCDGLVDVIGQQYHGRSDLDSYRRPSETIRLLEFAGGLDTAFRAGRIPYPQLRVCQ
jgi:S1-C subfamily serine protease